MTDCDNQSAVSVLSQINLLRIFPHHSFDSVLILPSDLRSRLQNTLLSSGFVAEETQE